MMKQFYEDTGLQSRLRVITAAGQFVHTEFVASLDIMTEGQDAMVLFGIDRASVTYVFLGISVVFFGGVGLAV